MSLQPYAHIFFAKSFVITKAHVRTYYLSYLKFLIDNSMGRTKNAKRHDGGVGYPDEVLPLHQRRVLPRSHGCRTGWIHAVHIVITLIIFG